MHYSVSRSTLGQVEGRSSADKSLTAQAPPTVVLNNNGAEPSTGEFGDGGEEGGCVDGEGVKGDCASLMESHEAYSSGSVSSGGVRHDSLSFDPHIGSVLSLKVRMMYC